MKGIDPEKSRARKKGEARQDDTRRRRTLLPRTLLGVVVRPLGGQVPLDTLIAGAELLPSCGLAVVSPPTHQFRRLVDGGWWMVVVRCKVRVPRRDECTTIDVLRRFTSVGLCGHEKKERPHDGIMS